MNFEVTNTDKKINSTKIISSGWVTISNQFKMKENTNITFPTFIVNKDSISSVLIPTYNYVKLTVSNNVYYYFILNWESGNNGCWYVYCAMDVLATYKSSILSKTLYVLRSSSNYDLTVVDTQYPIKNVFTHNNNEFNGTVTVKNRVTGSTAQYTDFFSHTFEDGYYYLKLVDGTTTTGSVIYSMSYVQFKDFIGKIFNIDYNQDFPDIATGVARGVANVFQYIVECYWLPCLIPGYTPTRRNIQLGPYTLTDIMCCLIDNPPTMELTYSINYSNHPQISRGYYLNSSPYSTRVLIYYPFGVYRLDDPTMIAGNFTLDVNVKIDTYTGDSILEVSNNESHTLYITDTGNYKVPIQLNETSLTVLGAIGSAINDGKQAIANNKTLATMDVTGRLVGAAVLFGLQRKMPKTANALTTTVSVKSNIGDILQASGTELHNTGTTGSVLSFSIKPRVVEEFSLIVEEDLNFIGRPLCDNRVLNTLSGYCLCKDNDIGIENTTQDQLELIRNYLTTGFFIE